MMASTRAIVVGGALLLACAPACSKGGEEAAPKGEHEAAEGADHGAKEDKESKEGGGHEPKDEAKADEGGGHGKPAAKEEAAPEPTSQPGDLPAPPDVAVVPANAFRSGTGLGHRIIRPSTLERRTQGNAYVKIHYTGWTDKGVMFDSSVTRKSPLRRTLDEVIPGWAEGIPLMVKGEIRRFWIPQDLAHNGSDTFPKRGVLVFDIELLEVTDIPDAPAHLKEPPPDGTKTASGLVWKLDIPGQGGPFPTTNSMVKVHYIAWDTAGKVIDTTYKEGTAKEMRLDSVIKGWTEGLQLMTAGETRYLWVPHELAYKDVPERPQGMLIYRINLISFKDAPPKKERPPPKPAEKEAAPEPKKGH